jgi:hypothetical protein
MDARIVLHCQVGKNESHVHVLIKHPHLLYSVSRHFIAFPMLHNYSDSFSIIAHYRPKMPSLEDVSA